MWQVQMEFIPGNSIIWVARLNPDDLVYEYDNESEAQAKANELKSQDTTERLYRIVQL